MTGIDQIGVELTVIDADASRHSERLTRERGEIINTINKTQTTFGDQEPGQSLIITLSHVINNAVNAESAIDRLKSDIREYIRQIQR